MLEQVDLSLGIPKEEYNELVEQLGYRLGELQRRCRDAGIPLVVGSNDKYYSRIRVLETFNGRVSAKIDERKGAKDPPRK